jgi:hypothetical protein
VLRNKLFRVELKDVLYFGDSMEEFSNLFTPVPSPGKCYIRHVGHDPDNVFCKQVQERWHIARLDALICLLNPFDISFFVQVSSFHRSGAAGAQDVGTIRASVDRRSH